MIKIVPLVRLWIAKKKGLHSYFKAAEATLYINSKDYAYLEIDGVRYYFHSSDNRVVRYKNIKTFSGEKLQQSIIPYDGYEISTNLKKEKNNG